MKVQEAFANYSAMAASGQVIAVGDGATCLGGFLCTTSGSLKLTEGVNNAGTTIVDTMAVTAGGYYPIPCPCPKGAYADLTGGAKGTFFYGGG